MRSEIFLFVIVVAILSVSTVTADFEEQRCRCLCPDTAVVKLNSTKRRYYTRTNINSTQCGDGQAVVGHFLKKLYGDNTTVQQQIAQFLPRCNCVWSTRNLTKIKVVVILVISVISGLVCYMVFLLCLDPMMARRKMGSELHENIPYEEHSNDISDENIFQNAHRTSLDDSSLDEPGTSNGDLTTVRSPTTNVIQKVEAEQKKWRKQVEVQRKKIFTDHTMLN